MTPQLLFGLAVSGWLLSLLSATAARSLHSLAVHELEELCRRRNRMEWFRFIVLHRERLTQGAESMRAMSTVLAVTSLSIGFVQLEFPGPAVVVMWGVPLVVASLAMLAANSWIPHAVSRHAAVVFLFYSWQTWWFISILTWPMIWLSEVAAGIFQRAAGVDEDDDDEEEQLEDEIRSIVSEGERDGLLEPDERGMIENVLELDERDVCSVMMPRSKLDVLEVHTAWDEAVRFVVASGRARIPVYEERLDNIQGILLAKDLLRESLVAPAKRRPLKKLIRRVLMVPESTMLDEMLQQFLQQRTHMAVVIDEYGGVAGLLTIEDILEEIVGEIVDETDDEQPAEFTLVRPGQVRLDGIVRVDQINDRMGTELPEKGDFDTISGLVLSHLGRIPRAGTEVVLDNVRIRVLKASPRTIEKVQLEIDKDFRTTVRTAKLAGAGQAD